jgi:hypothetical protein
MRLPKYFVGAAGAVLAAFAYTSLVRWESESGITWYKVAAPLFVLAITNAVQLWTLGFGAVTLNMRLRVNLELWAIVGTSVLAYTLLSRPGLLRTAWRSPGVASVFLARVCLLLVGMACLNALIGWFVAKVKVAY